MKKTGLAGIIRGYILAQILLLCLTLCVLGVQIVTDRTEYIQNGTASVVLQTDEAVIGRDEAILRILLKSEIRDKLCSLPTPIGNLMGVIFTLEEI